MRYGQTSRSKPKRQRGHRGKGTVYQPKGQLGCPGTIGVLYEEGTGCWEHVWIQSSGSVMSCLPTRSARG